MKSNICLAHGLFGHLNAPEILGAFHPDTSVSAPDLIGYGASRDMSVNRLTLTDQAAHATSHIEASHSEPVHLVGHSVGGAVSVLVAHARPDLVKSLISVEGNFTLKDAFWSAEIARKGDRQVEDIVEGYRSDPDGWMNGAISRPSILSSRLAIEWLDNQPARTIKAQAAAVVAATDCAGYLETIRSLMTSQLPVHLISGVHSASGWDTPDWANELCTSRINIPDSGHLMMVEAPARFAGAIQACIRLSSVLE